MVASNRGIVGVAGVLLLMAGLSFALPSAISEISHSNPLACEGKFKDAEKLTFNETSLHVRIRKLINTYTDWGEHLDSAPSAISILGKLIIMSDQHRRGIRKNKSSKNKLFAFHNYPKSIRSSLLQISQKGNIAFLKAHRNMEKIRIYNSNVPRHIKDTTRYVMSRNLTYYINQSLPISMLNIYNAALQSKELAAQVVKDFQIVLQSIDETINTSKQMELRRRKTQQVVQRNKSLSFTRMYYKETIKAMQKASNELDQLKTALTQLMTFYTKMSVFITEATVENVALIYTYYRKRSQNIGR